MAWEEFDDAVTTLTLSRSEDAFELRAPGALLGLLTRPREAYLAATRDGSWEFSHPRRSGARIEAHDAEDRSLAAEYR